MFLRDPIKSDSLNAGMSWWNCTVKKDWFVLKWKADQGRVPEKNE